MRQIKKGKTNVSVDLYIIDSTDGTPETGVVWNSSGIDLKYRREGAAVVSVTEATLAALTTAHTDGGFLTIGFGSYRFDVPDAAFATGASTVTIFGTVTGMIVLPVVIQLVDFDPEDEVRLGLTALPNATADGVGGLPISDAGGLDIDTLLGRLTAARAQVLDDWINAGRLDAIIDAIKAVTDNLPDSGALTTLITHLTDIKGATFSGASDSLEAIRDRGDTAWITGGGGGITDILNIKPVIPISIDLANTATVRIGLMLTNAVDDLPSTAEITPGTIDIHRKAIGGTSWSSVVSGSACSEQAGMIYFDEVFDAGTGYAEGDSIRITFKSQKITVAANDYEITDANGVMFQTQIRQSMRGTDSAALASVCTEARLAELAAANIPADVDTLLTRIAQTLNLTALGNIGIDWANVENKTTVVDLSATDINLVDTTTTNTDMRGTDSANTVVPDVAGTAATPAEVLTQINAALDTAISELAQAKPTATPTMRTGLMLVYMALRNKLDLTATTKEIHDDAGTMIAQKAVTDDGTTYSEAEMEAGT